MNLGADIVLWKESAQHDGVNELPFVILLVRLSGSRADRDWCMRFAANWHDAVGVTRRSVLNVELVFCFSKCQGRECRDLHLGRIVCAVLLTFQVDFPPVNLLVLRTSLTRRNIADVCMRGRDAVCRSGRKISGGSKTPRLVPQWFAHP